MAVYAYKAIDASRSTQRGTVTADTPRQARELLRSRGLVVREMNVGRRAARSGAWRVPWRTGQAKLAATTRELATLLGVGIPLTEALQSLVEQHSGRYRTALEILRDRIAAGASLADAMAEQPDVFDQLSIRMVEVGESAGTLDGVLEQLADFKERSLQLKDRVLNAVLYPAVVFATACGVTIFLMVFVVPMLLTNLLEAGRPLPWPTRVLNVTSNLLLNHGWWLAIVAVAVGVGLIGLARTPRGRRVWQRLLLKIPLLGTMAQKQAIARISLVLATLLKSGVVYLKAVDIASRSSRNVLFQDALQASGEAVRAGKDIGEALASTGVFPPVVIHIFTVGQASGQLDSMLERLANNYDQQVSSASARLASVLEPILILLLAFVVGFILFATLLPILEAGNVL